MALVNGSDLIVRMLRHPLGIVPIAFATECALEVEGDFIDQTNKDSEGWQESIVGLRSWTISVTALYENFRFAGFIDKYVKIEGRNQVQVELTLRNPGTDNVKYLGFAYIISLNLKGETEGAAEYQCFLEGSSNLQQLTA